MIQKNFIGIDYYKLAEDPDKYRYIVTEKCGPNEEEKAITCVLQKPCASAFKSIFKIVKSRWGNSAENVIITMPPGARIEERKHLIKEMTDAGVKHPLTVSRPFAQSIEYCSDQRKDNSPVATKSGWYPFKVQSAVFSDAFSHIVSIAVRQNHISVSYVLLHGGDLSEDAFADAYYDLNPVNSDNPVIESLTACLKKIQKVSHAHPSYAGYILLSEEDLDEYKPFTYYKNGNKTDQSSGREQITDFLRSYYPNACVKYVSFQATARGAAFKHASTVGDDMYPGELKLKSKFPHPIWVVNDSFSKYKQVFPEWGNTTYFATKMPTSIQRGVGKLFVYEGNTDEGSDFKRISEISFSVMGKKDNDTVSVDLQLKIDENMIPKVVRVIDSSGVKAYPYTEVSEKNSSAYGSTTSQQTDSKGNTAKNDLTSKLNTADTLHNQENYDEELKLLKELESENPNLSQIKLRLGRCYRCLNHYQMALDAYSEAEKIEPSLLQIPLNRAIVYLCLGNNEKACQYFDEALLRIKNTKDYEKNPNYSIALANSAVAEKRRGNKELAEKRYAEAVRHGYENASAIRKMMDE